MFVNNITLSVLVKGKPITEYFHRGQHYVEGREGSAYELEVRNANPFRVEVVLSVDGLSVLDGKEAGPQSSGYIVDANSTIRIPGWKLDNAQAARFEFAGKHGSYATAMTGSSRNNGVIGALVYRERERPVFRHPVMPAPGFPNTGVTPWVVSATGGWSQGVVGGMADGGWSQGSIHGVLRGVADARDFATAKAVALGAGLNGIAVGCAAQETLLSHNATTVGNNADAVQSLGTGFGAATDFATTEVRFERGDMLAMLVVYYDSARGLRQRGIEVGRRQQKFASQPQAFPAMQTGCQPPPGWKG